MKKVINGSLYNTETARKLGNWSNNRSCTDFDYCEETLYRTKAGKYFIHGKGGARSRYSKQTGIDSWRGGENIIACTYDEARKWAENHLDGDDYIAAFGEPEEDGTEVCMVRLPAALKAQLDREVSRTGKAQAHIVAEALKAYFEE